MERSRMDELIEAHLKAEMAGDTAGSVAMFTDDVVHDVVGNPAGPAHGRAAAQDFYDYLTSNVRTEAMTVTRSNYGDDFCVVEHDATGVVVGEFMGVPGDGKRISFRLLHVWEFEDDKISREQVWIDGGSVVAQLTGVPA